MTDLYSLRSTTTPGEYIIIKLDEDYSVLSIYALSAGTCTCPQGFKPKCKHRRMLPMFLEHGHVDDGWFLIWQSRLWQHPIGEASERSSNVGSTSTERIAPPPLADTTILGNAEHQEAIAARMAPALATEGSNLVLSPGVARDGLGAQAKPGELRRRRF